MSERDIFLTAREQADPAARAAFMAEACAGDAALRARVERLLRADGGHDSILDVPAIAPLDTDPLAGFTPLLPPDLPPAQDDNEDFGFLAPPGRANSLGRIGHYEVLQVLGKGGFGIVFRAFDEVLQRVVAVKVLAPQLAVTSPARKRFLREAQSSAKVRHENVVQIHAIEEKPLPYLVMEFIPGETLQQRLNRLGPVEAFEVQHIGRQIAAGLAAAHATGLVHRDIKPANVLLEHGSLARVKLTDFGLARAVDDASLSHSGFVSGTPMYMSPEQARGEPVDARSDLFSLGSVLYTMCTGRPPFRAANTLAVLKRVNEDTPRPIAELIPETPPWLCDLIARLHAKNPDERCQSAQEVAELLAHQVARIQQPDSTPAVQIEPRSPTRDQGAATVAEISAPPASTAARQAGRSPWTRRGLIALTVLLLLAALGISEATSVTELHSSVMRLFALEEMPVVQADEPQPKASKRIATTTAVEPKGTKVARPPAKPNFALRFTKPGPGIKIPDLQLPSEGPLTSEGYVTIHDGSPSDNRKGYDLLGAPYQFVLQYNNRTFLLFGKDAFIVKYAACKAPSVYVPNRKYHLAGVRADDEFQFFLDGVRVATCPAVIGRPQPFRIGDGVVGDFEEVRVSTVVRYTEDFQPQLRFEPDEHTLALFHFDEGQGDEFKDSSGNGHHGKLGRAAWVVAGAMSK